MVNELEFTSTSNISHYLKKIDIMQATINKRNNYAKNKHAKNNTKSGNSKRTRKRIS